MQLSVANSIIQAAFDFGARQNLQPLTICILDAGGHVVAAQRQDGSSNLRFEIARGKANAALGLGRSTRFMQEVLCIQRPGFMEALAVAAHGSFIPVAGGLIIQDAESKTIGAIGVTGDSADNDEAVAIAGVSAVELLAILG